MKIQGIKNKSITTLFVFALFFLVLGAGPIQCSKRVSFATQNLYLGADVTRIFQGVQPLELFDTIVETKFIERAVVLADILEKERPDVIGLQEVVKYRIQIPSDFTTAPIPNAVDIIQRDFAGNPFAGDFLDTLMTELEERGTHYKVGLSVTGTDMELPAAISPTDFVDIRLTTYDVILVKDNISIKDSFQKSYEHQFSSNLGGIPLEFTRNYGMLALKKSKNYFYVINTHLEAISPEIKSAQAAELIAYMRGLPSSDPIVLLGDFNSAAVGTGGEDTRDSSAVYETILADGFLDAVKEQRPRDSSSTCCHGEFLLDPEGDPGFLNTGRIDHIFYSSSSSSHFTPKGAKFLGLNEKSASGLWPSDHLGVFVNFEFSGE